jgi:hypothetical protein
MEEAFFFANIGVNVKTEGINTVSNKTALFSGLLISKWVPQNNHMCGII